MENAYGFWPLVVINSFFFVIFAFSFTKPKTSREWKSLGAFSAFVVALFVEMYGFPLTLYLLSGLLQSKYPQLDVFAHNSGHLWETLLGFRGDPHLNVLHIVSAIFIGGGMLLVARAWSVLFEAQKKGKLAVTGPYEHVRHPQYAGFVLVMLGFLIQWPTLLTLVMFPILVFVYTRLARFEEEEALRLFGEEYQSYMIRTPRFIPRIRGRIGGE
ncbi:MAG: isoprenylcysteine carboxylmethyltransferase family protein [Patescibacteria group bacterium]